MVDSGGLENRCGRKSTQSSNLCPTAFLSLEASHSWFIALVSKTGWAQALGGSNPPASEIDTNPHHLSYRDCPFVP